VECGPFFWWFEIGIRKRFERFGDVVTKSLPVCDSQKLLALVGMWCAALIGIPGKLPA
jgi:hypothetical protein